MVWIPHSEKKLALGGSKSQPAHSLTKLTNLALGPLETRMDRKEESTYGPLTYQTSTMMEVKQHLLIKKPVAGGSISFTP